MKRKLTVLIMSVTLCFGLAIPTSAFDENVDAATANAYSTVLAGQYEENNVLYTDLLDMDSNGSPELLVISDLQDDIGTVRMSIWQMKNNTAVRTSEADCEPAEQGHMGLIQCGKQIYAYAGTWSGGIGASYFDHSIIGANGISSTYHHGFQWPDPSEAFYEVSPSFTLVANGKKTSLTEEAYYQALSTYGMVKSNDNDDVGLPSNFTTLAVCDINLDGPYNYYWLPTEAYNTYSDLLLQLQLAGKTPEHNTPVRGTYEPLTISGLMYFDDFVNDYSSYTVSFEKALLQQKEITVLCLSDGGNSLETQPANLLYVKPGSRITITNSRSEGHTIDSMMVNGRFYGTIENGIYTESFGGSLEGDCLYSGLAEKSFKPRNFLHIGNYYVLLGDDSSVIPTVGGFSDVTENAYYADAVKWAVPKGITTGTSDTTFSPDAACTTGQIITFLWRAHGAPTVSGVTPFSDVAASDYFYQAALWAKDKGLISGTAFQGNAPCTRAATVTYLWKLAGRPSVGLAEFGDVPSNASYAQAVAWAVKEGITSGTGDQTFSPDSICTRGQIMTFIYRDMVKSAV